MNSSVTAAAEVFRTSQIAQGLSPATVSSYDDTLAQYGSFFRQSALDPFMRETLLAWKASLGEKNKMSTVELRMVHIDSFMKFAVEFHYISENPCTKSIKKTKKPPRKPYKNLLSAQEIVDLLLDPTCPKGMTRRLFPRNRAIITLLLTTAVRNTELRHLTPTDLKWDECKICLSETKGDKYREVSFPPQAQDAVREYLSSGVRPESAGNSDVLFGTLKDGQWQPITRQGLSALVERHVRMVTSHSGERSHALRHSSASYMLSNGASLDVLQDLMGHASPTTTRVYAERLVGNTATDVANRIFDKLTSASA